VYTRKYPKVGVMVLIAASMIVAVSSAPAAGAEVSAGTLAGQTAGGSHCC
jgi:hypothetical protein